MKLAIFDTETTGLPLHSSADLNKQPYIIEFAVAHIDSKTGKINTTYETLIKPPVPISEEITKITGLTDADVADAPDFATAFPIVQTAFKDCDVLVAHNLPFDESLLNFELMRHKLALELPPIKVCTVQLYLEQYGRRVHMRELYEYKLGKPLQQTHRALDDVRALCEIIIAEKLWEVM